MAPSALDVDELTLEPIDQWLDGIKAGFADKFLWIFSGMGIEDTEDLRLMKKGRVATMREDLPFQEQEVDSEEDQRPRAVVCLMRSEAWGEHVHVWLARPEPHAPCQREYRSQEDVALCPERCVVTRFTLTIVLAAVLLWTSISSQLMSSD